jgi:hypothetical protein
VRLAPRTDSRSGQRLGNLRGYVEEFAAEVLPALKSLETRKTCRRIYDQIAEVFCEFNVNQVSPAHIGRFMKARTRPATRMAQVYRSCLMQFFTWCCQPEQDLRTDNPVREITTKVPRKRKLTAAEYHAIRDQLLVSEKGNKRLNGEMMQCLSTFAISLRSAALRSDCYAGLR